MDLSNAGAIGSMVGGIASVVGILLSGKIIHNFINKSRNTKNSHNFKKAKFNTKGGDIDIKIGDTKADGDLYKVKGNLYKDVTIKHYSENNNTPSFSNLDFKLYKKIKKQIHDSINVIRNKDFGNAIHHKDIEDLHTIERDFGSVEFEFSDKELEKSKSNLFKAISDTLTITRANMFFKEGNDNFLEIRPLYHENPKEFCEIQDNLNFLGEELAQKYDEFLRLCRAKFDK